MSNVLILGGTGMLGSMVYNFMRLSTKYKLFMTCRKLPANFNNDDKVDIYNFDVNDNYKENLKTILKSIKPDYIINCIGIINIYCRDNDPDGIRTAININSLFPHILNDVVGKLSRKAKIIQIATDCVFSGLKGNYNEDCIHDPTDVYGKTKSLGEVNYSDNFLNVRCSIIGPEYKGKKSLLEWFLAQRADTVIKGYNHHNWNGVTTFQFAELCDKIISESLFEKYSRLNHTIHFTPNEQISKYGMLNIFNAIYEKNIAIEKFYDDKSVIDRTLHSKILELKKNNIEDAVLEQYNFIKNNNLY